MSLNLTHVVPGTGTLALTGAGEYLPGMEPVDRFLLERLGEPARVICLPTAAGNEGADRVRYWMELGVDHFTRLGAAQVEGLAVIDRSSALDEAHAERIRAANFVYFSGGKPPYLFDTLAGTPVWQAIHDVAARGGMVAGCSAGAMVFGERSINGPGPTMSFESFGWVKGVYVIPHFDEIPRALVEGARLMLRKWIMLGIEGYTALVAAPEGFCVRGRGFVEMSIGREKLRKREADGWW